MNDTRTQRGWIGSTRPLTCRISDASKGPDDTYVILDAESFCHRATTHDPVTRDLILAAPEMLDSLRELRRQFDLMAVHAGRPVWQIASGKAIADADAAIAKATGGEA